jgi:mannose-1-phosphate guanylyltransferase
VLGLSGMTFLALGAGRRLWTLSRSETPKRQHLTRRARNRMFDEFLRKTQMIGRSSAEDQVRFYSEVSQFVREYLSEWLEIDASSLTPEELEIVLKNLGRDKLGAAVKTVLERCERVLYTPQGSELGKDWRDEVQRELGALAERRLARRER